MLVAIALGIAALAALLWLSRLWVAPFELHPEAAPPAGAPPRVSVVLPMFNEEQNVDGVLESLRAQTYGALEVIAVNDRSSDGTAAKLAEWQRRWPELKVVILPDHPEEWKGKSWPMYHGAHVATGEWLLFLDADLRLEPGSIAGTVGTCRARGWDGLGVLGQVGFGGWLARVLQADLMSLYLALAAEAPHALSCGHYMLVRCDAYRAAGGWAMVYDEMQDDVALPRLLSENGYVPRLRVSRDSHAVLPYRNLRELWRAMRRVIAGGAGFRPRYGVLGSIFSLLVNLLPLLILLEGLREGWWNNTAGRFSLAFVAAIVACALLGYARLLRTMGASAWLALTRPLGDVLVCGVQIDAAARAAFGRLEWKGVAFTGRRGFPGNPWYVTEFVAMCRAARTQGWSNAWVARLARESELLRLVFAARRHRTLTGLLSLWTQPLTSWIHAVRLARHHGKHVRAEAGVSRRWLFSFLAYGWLLAQLALWTPPWLRWSARRRKVAPVVEGLSAEELRALRGEAFRRFEQQHRPWFQATPWDRKPEEVVAASAPPSGAAQ